MPIAVNSETGEQFELQGNRWVPVRKREEAPEAPKLTTGAINAALISAGDVLTTVGRNARDVYAMLRGDEGARAGIEQERAEADVMRDMLHQEAPKAAFVGGMLPALATLPIGGAPAAGASVARTALGAMGSNAAMSAIQSTSGNFLQDAIEGALWSAGGMGASNLSQRIWSGAKAGIAARGGEVASKLHDEEQRIVEGAQRAGMRVTPGQQLGDPTMRQFEDSLSSNPMMGRVFSEIDRHNTEQLNTLAARAMGVNANHVGSGVLARAEAQIGQSFDEIGKRIGVVDAAPIKKALTELAADESVAVLPKTQINHILNRFGAGEKARTAAAGGVVDQVTGPALMRERSELAGEMAAAYRRHDPTLGNIYGKVIDVFDEAITKSAIRTAGGDFKAGEDLARLYDRTREQWTVLKTMERGGASIDGNVMGAQASNILRNSDKIRYMGRANEVGETTQRVGTGRLGEDALGDFYDALRFKGSQIGKPLLPPTGVRNAFGNWLNSGGTLPSAVAGVGAIGKRFTASPLARSYASMSPQAASTMMRTIEAMRAPISGGTAVEVGRWAGRLGGGGP